MPLFGSAPSEGGLLPLLLVPGWLAVGGGGLEVMGHFVKVVGRLRYLNES